MDSAAAEAVDGGSSVGLAVDEGFGLAVDGLAVCGLFFCGAPVAGVGDGVAGLCVELLTVDGFTTGFVVENVVVTDEFNGRIDVTVVYGDVLAWGLAVEWCPVEYCKLLLVVLDAVELGTLNWTVGLAV